MTLIIVVTLLAIVASLGRALFSMASGPQNSAQMVNALSVRIGLSVVLFILLLVGKYFGWLTPNGL